MNNQAKRFLVLVGLIVGAMILSIVARSLPHIPNFAPIAAIALFSGAYFLQRKWAFAITFLALFASDFALQIQYWMGTRDFAGFYPNMIFVYGAIAMVLGIGFLLKNKVSALNVLGGAIGGSVLFYIVSNFGVWLLGTMYSKSFAGLIECYVAGIPFYRGTILGDVIYSAILFGAFELILQAKSSWKLAPYQAK